MIEFDTVQISYRPDIHAIGCSSYVGLTFSLILKVPHSALIFRN